LWRDKWTALSGPLSNLRRPEAGSPARPNKNCSSQSPDLTVVYVPHSLDSGPQLLVSSGHVFMIYTRAQQKILSTWMTLVTVRQHLVQIGRIERPTKYLKYMLAVIRSVHQNREPEADGSGGGVFHGSSRPHLGHLVLILSSSRPHPGRTGNRKLTDVVEGCFMAHLVLIWVILSSSCPHLVLIWVKQGTGS